MRYLEKIKVSPASCTAAADFDKFKRSRLMPCACNDRVLEVGRRSDCRPGSRPYHTLASRSNVTFSCIAQDSHGNFLPSIRPYHTAHETRPSPTLRSRRLTEYVKVATERISACPGHIGDDRTSECKLRHRLTISWAKICYNPMKNRCYVNSMLYYSSRQRSHEEAEPGPAKNDADASNR